MNYHERVFPTFYKVNFWDEDSRATITMHGVLFATTYADAIEQLSNYYGDADMNAVQIIMCEENYLLEIADKDLWGKVLAAVGGQEAFQ